MRSGAIDNSIRAKIEPPAGIAWSRYQLMMWYSIELLSDLEKHDIEIRKYFACLNLTEYDKILDRLVRRF